MRKALVTEPLVAASPSQETLETSSAMECASCAKAGEPRIPSKSLCAIHTETIQAPISQTFPVAEVNESGHQGSDPSKTQIPKETRLRHHEDRKTRPVCGQPSEIYNVTDHLAAAKEKRK